jgi:hypothetical protein
MPLPGNRNRGPRDTLGRWRNADCSHSGRLLDAHWPVPDSPWKPSISSSQAICVSTPRNDTSRGDKYANSAFGLDSKVLMGMGRRHMQDYWSHLDQKSGDAQHRSRPLTFPMGQGDGILGMAACRWPHARLIRHDWLDDTFRASSQGLFVIALTLQRGAVSAEAAGDFEALRLSQGRQPGEGNTARGVAVCTDPAPIGTALAADHLYLTAPEVAEAII